MEVSTTACVAFVLAAGGLYLLQRISNTLIEILDEVRKDEDKE